MILSPYKLFKAFFATVALMALAHATVLLADGGESVGPLAQPIRIDRLGIAIAPPAGWEVKPSYFGLSLVLQEPKPEKITDYSKPVFQRNITVAVSHEASPIDEMEAKKLSEDLITRLGSQGGVENFRVSPEPKFFDYKAKNDGVILYSFFDINKIPLTQMHVLVAGEKNRVLLTYTDLSERFEENLDPAWQSLMSIEIVGQAPTRFEQVPIWLSIPVLILLVLLVLVWRRRRRMKKLLRDVDQDFAEDVDFETKKTSPKVKSKATQSKSSSDKALPPPPRVKPRIRVNSQGIQKPRQDEEWFWPTEAEPLPAVANESIPTSVVSHVSTQKAKRRSGSTPAVTNVSSLQSGFDDGWSF